MKGEKAYTLVFVVNYWASSGNKITSRQSSEHFKTSRMKKTRMVEKRAVLIKSQAERRGQVKRHDRGFSLSRREGVH